MYDTCYMENSTEETRRALIVENLSSLIEEKGIAASKISKDIGMSHTTVRHILLGNSKNPQHSTLVKIAEYLNEDVKRITVGPDYDKRSEATARILDQLSQLSDEKRSRLEGYLEALSQEPDR